jgi:L-ascorbate metabolism protein UlaG (beta-lactamase superfamily)
MTKNKYPYSDHFDGKRFHNLIPTAPKSLWDVFFKWKLRNKATPWPKWRDFPKKPYRAPDSDYQVTFINHVTFLIEWKGLVVLTDPHFSMRASPFKFVGPARVHSPAFSISELPKIDVVLISHNHYDHLDSESLIEIKHRFDPLFVVPLGDEILLKKLGMFKIKSMDWWNKLEMPGIKIHFTPTQHWSARGMNDRNLSLWGGYFIEDEQKKLYFAGDTGYANHFKMTLEKLGAPHLALLPIGAYEPRWFMKEMHMNPAEAIRAHEDLNAIRSIGMHFGTFQLTDEGIDEPVKDLIKSLKEKNISEKIFIVPSIGERFTF